jgi:hypothetical protein
MMRTFRDRLRHEPTVRLWIDVLKDAVVSIPHRYWVQDPHSIFPPSSAPLRAAYAVVAQSMLVGGFLAGMMVALAVVMAFELPGPWRAAGLVPVCLALYLTPWSLRRARRASQIVKSYQADTTPESVTISGAGLAPLTLQRGEIVGLHLFENVGLRIQAADPARDLWVPARTTTFAAVSERVSGWAPTTVTPFLHHAADNLRWVAIMTVLAVVIPVKIGAGFVVGASVIPIIATLRRRDVPVLRKLPTFAPVLVLVVRWLW